VADWILAVIVAAAALTPMLFLLHLPHLRQLATLHPPEPEVWPRVSVIVPARDEADRIGPALESRLADDYPDLEIVVVDDRSGDGTGDAARAAGAGDPRLRVVRVDELPEGWLGKVHALDAGVRGSRGEWLLFSDADVHVGPGTTARAVAAAVEAGADLVAVIPAYRTGAMAMDAVWAVFLTLLGAVIDPAAVRDPLRRRSVVGSGAYTLVRRAALERTGGMEWLRMETGDDMALARMVKAGGGRCDVLGGRGEVSVAIYRSVGEFVRGVEKNGGTAAGMPFAVFAAAVVFATVVNLTPLLVALLGPGWVRWAGLTVLAVQTIAHVTALHSNCGQGLHGLAWPLGSLIMAFGLVRSAWLVRRRGGVMWRGTFYPIDVIDEGRRFELTP
jgi:hypothetical protein